MVAVDGLELKAQASLNIFQTNSGTREETGIFRQEQGHDSDLQEEQKDKQGQGG